MPVYVGWLFVVGGALNAAVGCCALWSFWSEEDAREIEIFFSSFLLFGGPLLAMLGAVDLIGPEWVPS